ncbi:hypothetical protein [Brevibacillus centrosporus]|uniref:Uncharacterized protein n=1 Tax=Brevibacillus centrosporus TaxID=54910 RepID=A0A1I4EAP4_9BACL|nr:hypothetical protein [Brevibacillus centrosporus]MEC2133123.1 hypothetical protein [Brevibacillus centrosporus]MED4912010.1 hypothetical protein [Brevibacillus centrosporus]RNB62848.1 hypothetical protein EDM55_29730 [Brevibacillus centrosporus]SFL01446.1 hypothetical protein SAMN05518846_12939 [Brevibacillus centrosporus]GED33789.1 hypothetical protein BCE02nite_49300 [Brevibacillus centrosporus]
MLANSAIELVNRCYEETFSLVSLEELKESFIVYVFGDYQDEFLKEYDLEDFYEHLDYLQLTNCRRDFDKAVEEWFVVQYGPVAEDVNYHDILFTLVKEAVVQYQSQNRIALIRDVTKLLTIPNGFIARWQNGLLRDRSLPTYFKYLMKLGIRSHEDIETLVDMWLVEYPNAFDKKQQQLFANPPRRGRPNNVELALLIEMAYEFKPEMTPQERERLRKIYYYHRKSLTIREMVVKFKNYISSKTKSDDDTQVG